MNKNNFLKFLAFLFCFNFISARDWVAEAKSLKQELNSAYKRVFINRPIKNWSKDIIEKGQEKNQAHCFTTRNE